MADEQSLRITHLVYSGLAGSPRGTLYLAEGENQEPGYHPSVLFIGRELEREYVRWCDAAGIEYAFVKKRSRYDLRFMLSLYRAFRGLRPDLVFVHGTINLLYALPYLLLWPRRDFILVEHGPALHLDQRATRWMARLANRTARGLVLVSRELEAGWRAASGGFPPRHTTIPNGVDLEEFRNQSRGPHPVPRILMVAIMSSQKDHLTLIRAVHRLRQERAVELCLVGEGETRPLIEAELKTLGAEAYTTIVSSPARERLREIFVNASVYVQSTNGEGLSRAILEAMVARIPVVGTDVSGNRDIIHHGTTGLLTPAGDVEGMARAIATLLDDPDQARSLAEAAYTFVSEHHSIRSTVRKYLQFIATVKR